MSDGNDAPASADRPTTSANTSRPDGRDGPGPDAFRLEVDDPEQVCYRVVEAVAAITGVPSTRLPPLEQSLDPDALRRLATWTGDRDSSTALRVSFTYAGCDVVYEHEGELTVWPPEAEG